MNELNKPYIQVENLKKYFSTKRGMLHAVDDVSFSIQKGETLGLVGESGCGKSTLGRCLIRLLDSTAGSVLLQNERGDGYVDVTKVDSAVMKELRKRVQIVFQDPYSCLNPRLSVWELIADTNWPVSSVNDACARKRSLAISISNSFAASNWAVTPSAWRT